MIPRLPPLLLVALGSASIYGIKYILDKLEPKAIGPPGYSKPNVLSRMRQYPRQIGYLAAGTGIAYACYAIHDSRKHRPTPATISVDPEHAKEFYQNQYNSRDHQHASEVLKAQALQKEKEQKLKHLLVAEQEAMDKASTVDRR